MEIHPSPSGRLPQAGGQQGEQEGVIGVAAPDAFELPGRFEQTEQAFDTFINHKDGAVKVVIHPNGEEENE